MNLSHWLLANADGLLRIIGVVSQPNIGDSVVGIRIHAMLSYTDGWCFTWHECERAWVVAASDGADSGRARVWRRSPCPALSGLLRDLGSGPVSCRVALGDALPVPVGTGWINARRS